MQNSKKVLMAFFLLATLLGCGDPSSGSAGKANRESVENLSSLMKANPEFSGATLRQIKDAAAKTNGEPAATGNGNISSTGGTSYVRRLALHTAETKGANGASAPAEGGNSAALDPEVAEKAQNFIDDILNKFDLVAWVRANYKLAGVAINNQEVLIERYQALKNSKFAEGRGDGLEDDKLDNYKENMRSCEEFVANPVPGMPWEDIEYIISLNNQSLRESLSGCAEIIGSQFVKCVQDFNTYVELLDETASCDVKTFIDLHKALNKKMAGKFNELERSVNKCMKAEFTACGYAEEEIKKEKDNKAQNNTVAGSEERREASK